MEETSCLLTCRQFHDELLENKENGGIQLATLLHDAISDDVIARFPKIARNKYSLVIRVFASLHHLSKEAATKRPVGGHYHALASFFVGFTRSGVFFGFVDTGDVDYIPAKICRKYALYSFPGSTDERSAENFKFYMADQHCKHVFVAAGSSPLYIQTLEPYRAQTEKVTLVLGTDVDRDMRKLGLHAVTFHKVFAGISSEAFRCDSTRQLSAPTIRSADELAVVSQRYRPHINFF